MQRRFHGLRGLCSRGGASKVNATGPILASDDFTVRLCKGMQEFERCAELRRLISGCPDLDVVPVQMFVVGERTGGHSRLVEVIPEYEDRGIGRALELQQRELYLRQKIRLIERTFDPLEIRSARFNIALGVIVRSVPKNTTETKKENSSKLQHVEAICVWNSSTGDEIFRDFVADPLAHCNYDVFEIPEDTETIVAASDFSST